MATVVLTDAKIWMGEYDISTDHNKIQIGHGAQMLEDTVFGSAYHTNKPGLKKVKYHAEGLTQFGSGVTTIDGRQQAKFAVQDVPITVSKTGTFGLTSYFFKGVHGMFSRGAAIGELCKFQMDAEASGTNVALVRGTILEDGTSVRSTSGSGTFSQLGAVSATQYIYAVLHMIAATGLTSVVFTLQSAATSGGSYTTRATFATSFAAIGSEYLIPVIGPVTDTWWKLTWTLTGTSFQAVCSMGIQ